MGRQDKFYRSRGDRVLGGVCGGLAAYLGIDPILVRIGWVVVTVASVGLGLLAYILLWVFAPEEPPGSTPSDAPEEPEPVEAPRHENRAAAPAAKDPSKASPD